MSAPASNRWIVRKYALKRIFTAVTIMWAVATIVFLSMRLVPSDPAMVVLGENATAETIGEWRSPNRKVDAQALANVATAMVFAIIQIPKESGPKATRAHAVMAAPSAIAVMNAQVAARPPVEQMSKSGPTFVRIVHG